MMRLHHHAAIVALAFASVAAHASLIDARFSGTVDDEVNTAFAVGATVSGEFVYDTTIGRYLSFTIGGQSVAPGFASTASITPDLSEAIYRAQVSPVGGGSTQNSSFLLDLVALTTFPSNDAIGLLLNSGQLATNLDPTFSHFFFLNGNANGTVANRLDATLDAIRVTAVPEPGAVALFVIGLVAVGVGRARGSRR